MSGTGTAAPSAGTGAPGEPQRGDRRTGRFRRPRPAADGSTAGSLHRVAPRARRFLARRARVVARLALWSGVESAHAFLGGFSTARALDDGFLAGRVGIGLAWLAVAAAAVLVGGTATRGVFRGLAGLVEPLRDGLVRHVVSDALRTATSGTARPADSAAVSRLTHQTETARDSFAGLVLVARSFVFTAAGALLGLASLAPLLLVVVAPPLLLGLLLFLATLPPMAARQRAFLRADEDLAACFGAAAAGVRDITACGAQDRTAAVAQALTGEQTRAARSLARWAAVRCAALGLAGQGPVLLLLAATPWLLAEGVTAGALLGALTFVTQALQPALQSLMSALGAAGTRLLVVLDHLLAERAAAPAAAPAPAAPPPAHPVRPGDPAPPGGPPAPRTSVRRASSPGPRPKRPDAVGAPAAAALEIRSLTFAYGPGALPVVQDLDLRVEAGEHLAIVGPSGIGKSTLAALVAGLLVPDRGEVRLDGEPVRPHRADRPSRHRVLIPQQAYVFTGSMRDNLLYLSPGEPPGQVRPKALAASAEAVGLDPLLRRLGGPDAPVDPAALSPGERQLVALTRAHLSPAPLVLLDEATCHLDPAAEARAERAFAERPGTLVVIAHRISSARRADRVLVLDGVHAACGPHEDLLDQSALYRDLVGHWEAARP